MFDREAALGALRDAEPFVRVEAGRALVRIGLREADVEAVVARFDHADAELGSLLAEAVAGAGPAALPHVVKLLEGRATPGRLHALAAVHLMGRHAAGAVPALLDLLAQGDAAAQKLAAEGLRRCGPWAEEFTPEIVDRLRFGDEKVKRVAATVLGLIGPGAAEAIPSLKEALAEGSDGLKAAAAEALRRVDVVQEKRESHPGLRDPAAAAETAPETFRVRFETTRGEFVVEVHRAWAPHGADRFFNLVRIGFFDDTAFYRVVKGFVVQFGLNGDSRVNAVWKDRTIPADPRKESNRRGTLSYAQLEAPDSRATQVFVNLSDNTKLDDMGFVPFGRVVSGLDVVEALYDGYGDGPPFGKGPDQRGIVTLGNEYLKQQFPKLDAIRRATVVE